MAEGWDYRVREFVRRLWVKSAEDDIFFMAGAISFSVLVALVPLLILLIGLSGFILSARFPDPTEAVLSLLAESLPTGGEEIALIEALRGPVRSIVEGRAGLTVVGALVFVWLATRLVASLRVCLREIFDVGRDRGIVGGKLFDIQVVVIGVVLLTLNVGVTVVVEAVADLGVELAGLGPSTLTFTRFVIAQALALASIWTLFLFVYRFLPARPIPWRTAIIAATFAALLHETLKWAFSWYLTDLANYQTTFGNLATVAALIFWIYYGSIVFIMGGEVAQVYTMRKASRVGVVSFEARS